MMFQLQVDGTLPLTPALVAGLDRLCDQAEQHTGPGIAAIRVAGAPGAAWSQRLGVGLVGKWERSLRRFERLPVSTVALGFSECGGAALDALLAADYRIVCPDFRLTVPVLGAATWPGMSLYRLAQQASPGTVRCAALLGCTLDVSEALATDLIDEWAVDPLRRLAELTASLSAFAGPDLARRRTLMFEAVARPYDDALDSHLAACAEVQRQA